jgi:integrase
LDGSSGALAAVRVAHVEDGGADLTVGPHDLRHTCAAILIANGRHMEEVKAHLGHGSIRRTGDTYGHLFKTAQIALADALEATFRGSLEAATAETRPKNEARTLRSVQ